MSIQYVKNNHYILCNVGSLYLSNINQKSLTNYSNQISRCKPSMCALNYTLQDKYIALASAFENMKVYICIYIYIRHLVARFHRFRKSLSPLVIPVPE